MDQSSFSELVFYFTLYSIVGWICETVWCSIGNRKFVNRGFLSGPWCPIYGFGAMLILSFTALVPQNPILIFLISMLAATVLEYFTGWLLEKLFQTRWWDYSQRRFQIKGRVCLGNSLLFGIMGLGAALLIHPAVKHLFGLIPAGYQRILTSFILVLLIVDLVHALVTITKLKERLTGLRALLRELEQYQKEHAWYEISDPAGSLTRLRTICEQADGNERTALMLQKIDELEKRKGGGFRILNAFPKMQPKGLLKETITLRQEWQAKRRKKKQNGQSLKARILHIRQAYSGVSLTQMIWVFLIGSVIGYVVETLYCLVTTGHIESRQGMLYGPFSQVYGFGAVLMALCLIPFTQKGKVWLFAGGAVTGGLFEAVCSLIQEALFGSVSWQYSHQPFSFFGGRTSLLYMFFWGLLGMFYMLVIYPKITNFIGRLALRPKRFFTIVIAVLLSANMLLSAAAVNRWQQRTQGTEPLNSVEETLDRWYPNEKMQEIYPNMQFIEEK